MKSQVIDLSVGVFVWGLMLLIFSVPCFADDSESLTYAEEIAVLKAEQIHISDSIGILQRSVKSDEESQKSFDLLLADKFIIMKDHQSLTRQMGHLRLTDKLAISRLQDKFNANEERIMILEALDEADKSLIKTNGNAGTVDPGTVDHPGTVDSGALVAGALALVAGVLILKIRPPDDFGPNGPIWYFGKSKRTRRHFKGLNNTNGYTGTFSSDFFEKLIQKRESEKPGETNSLRGVINK